MNGSVYAVNLPQECVCFRGELRGKIVNKNQKKPPKNPVFQMLLIFLNFCFLSDLCFHFPYRQRNQLAQALVCGISGIPMEQGKLCYFYLHRCIIRGWEAPFPVGRFICCHRSGSGLVRTIWRKIQGPPLTLTFS